VEKKPTPMGILVTSIQKRISNFEKILKNQKMSETNRYAITNIKKELESFRDVIIEKFFPLEQREIIKAYRESTLEQCRDIPLLFSETEMTITEDERALIDQISTEYFKDNYDNNSRG
jgi:tyrosyl-tRNA synthetase